MLRRLWAFVILTRPVFLFGGALLYALGAALARAAGASIDGGRYALGQVLVTAIQAMTHYANEYFDRESDRAIGANRTWFSGGSGVLPGGLLPARVALVAALACAGIAVAAMGLAVFVEPSVSLIGAAALLGGWFYSAPPIRLASSGFGEASAAVIVSMFVPLTALSAQGMSVNMLFLSVSAPLVGVSLAMQIAFEFPDFEADRTAGKRTLTVRLGRRRAARLHVGLIVSAFAVVLGALAADWIAVSQAAWLLLPAPLALWQIGVVFRQVHHVQSHHRLMTTGAVGLFALSSAAALAGILLRSAA